MKLACPSCHNAFEVLEVDSELSAQVSCGTCGAIVGITVAISILSAGEARDVKTAANRVVVAMNDPELRRAYAQALLDAGLSVIETGESRQTLQTLGKQVPAVAVIDGGFPPIFGMGIGEIIKKSNVTRETRVLGLRTDDGSPLPVPGADRSVSITMGTEGIVREVQALMEGPRPSVPAPRGPRPSSGQTESRPKPKPAAEPTPPPAPEPAPPRQTSQAPAPAPAPAEAPPKAVAPPPKPAAPKPAPASSAVPPTASRPAAAPVPDDPEHAAAQRLARIIVSDVALYNGPAVEQGIQTGRLKEALHGLMDEGRQHYEDKTPAHVRADTDYLGEALEQFVARKTKSAAPTAV
jgi:CheY-like chemotaxis protein